MKTATGELYFIGEVDPATRKPTAFTKIGLVRDTRASTSRLSDHQTGNPRELFIHEVLTTPLVERIETLMHGLRAPNRVGGEWFILDRDEVKSAIAEAKRHVRRARKVSSVVEAADELRNVTSTRKELPATPASRKLAKRHLELRVQERVASVIEKTVKEAYRTLHDAGADLAGRFAVQQRMGSRFLDEDALRAKHPKIWGRYQVPQESVKGTFRWTTGRKESPDLEKVNPALADIGRRITAAADKLTATSKAVESFHLLWLESLVVAAEVAWEAEILNAEGREMCGRSPGIEGLCTWERTGVTDVRFDRSAFRAEHSDLYDSFMRERTGTSANVVARDRGYRL